AFVQRYSYTARREGSIEAGFFDFQHAGHRRGGGLLVASGRWLDLGELDARFARHAPGVLLETGRHPGGRLVADTEDAQDQIGLTGPRAAPPRGDFSTWSGAETGGGRPKAVPGCSRRGLPAA